MELKVCPTCRTLVFKDMDVCYGCMYRFGSDPAWEQAAQREWDCSKAAEESAEEKKWRTDGKETRVISLKGWNVCVETDGPLPQGTSLRVTIEPSPA